MSASPPSAPRALPPPGPSPAPRPARPQPRWFRRAALLVGFLLAICLGLVVSRAYVLLRAGHRAASEALHAVPTGDLGGGFRIVPGETFRLKRPGPDRDLFDGEEFVVADHRFRFDAGGPSGGWRVILRRPLSVYAAAETPTGPRGGWNRLDLGGDPLGGLSTTRDQVYVDPAVVEARLPDGAKAEFARHLGFARLLPAEGEVFRLADTAFRVQAEVPGLSIERGSEALPLAPGEAQPFASGDVLSGLGHRIRISLQISTRSEPIRGPKGGIVGYRAVREPNLVVAIPEPGEGPAARHRASTVTYLPVEGEPTVYGLAPDRPNRFYGGDDRIGPAGGEVVPMDLPDRELIALFERGFRQGTIYADRGFVRVLDRHAVRALLGELPEGAGDAYLASLPDAARYRGIPEDQLRLHAEFLGEVARAVGNRVQGVVRDYDRGLDPGWVALPGEPEAFRLLPAEGAPRAASPVPPLVPGLATLAPPAPWEPQEVAPGEAVRWTLAGKADLPPGPDGTALLRFASPLPLEVVVDGGPPLVLPPPDPGAPPLARQAPLPGISPGLHELRVTATYVGRPADFGRRAPIQAEVEIGGAAVAPTSARIGELPFEGWCAASPGADAEAAGLWRAGQEPGSGVEISFLRLTFADLAPGPVRLRLETDGQVLEGCWNGVPLDPRRLDTPRAAVAGSNLLALKVAHRDPSVPGGAGGVRFLWKDGQPYGLSPEVVTRSARPAVVSRRDPPPLLGAGATVPRLVVERGVPGLPEGTEIPVGERLAGPGRVALYLPEEGAKGDLLVGSEGVRIRLKPGHLPPLEVMNGGRTTLSLFRQEDPTKKPWLPYPGFRIYAGRPEPFRFDRDAIRAGRAWLTYRAGTAGFARGEALVVAGGGLHRLLGTPGWTLPDDDALPPGEFLEVTRDGEGMVEVARAVSPAGDVERWTGVESRSGPGPLAASGRVLLPGSGLLLRLVKDDGATLRPEARPSLGVEPLLAASPVGLDPGVPVGLTLDADLQAAATDELRAQIAFAEELIAAGRLARAPGPGGLRGAFVALDAASGDVLAAATVSDPGIDPAVAPWGLSWAHPGSTFKMVTSLAALSQDSREVRAMLGGAMPAGLQAVASSGSLAGAKLARLAPEGGRPPPRKKADEPIRLRSKLNNHKRDAIPTPATVEEALRKSSNTWFGYLSLLMHRPLREGWIHAPVATPGQMDRMWPLQEWARLVGFGEVVDLFPGLPDDVSRRWPALDAAGRPVAAGDAGFGFTGRFPTEAMEDPQIAATGIGQGEVYATPLQMARVAAVVATGLRPEPRLLRSWDGDEAPPRPAVDLGLPERARERVREGLRRVVDQGSARLAFEDNPYRDLVFGKTGTAERPGPEGGHVTDSWFAGFVQDPTGGGRPVAFACLLPGAGLGGTHAAEVAERWTAFLVRHRGWDLASAGDGAPRPHSAEAPLTEDALPND